MSEGVTHRQQLVEMIKVLKTYRQQALSKVVLVEVAKSLTVPEKRLSAFEGNCGPKWKLVRYESRSSLC